MGCPVFFGADYRGSFVKFQAVLAFCYASVAIAQLSDNVSEIPIRFAPVIMARQIANYSVPKYPAKSLRTKSEGLAVASIKTDAHGKVVSVSILVAPDDDIKEAVAKALAGWTFSPAVLHGVMHPAVSRILFYFWCKGPAGEVVIPGITDTSR
jgi:TonB family protein